MMDAALLLQSWHSLHNWLWASEPTLPSLDAMAWVRQGGWALVLFCIVWQGSLGLRHLPRPVRSALATTLALAALWPGPMGLSHWLGLAFQSPGLATIGLALWGIARGVQPRDTRQVFRPDHAARMTWLLASLVVVALGWLLLLDTLALLPVFVYPLGYSRGAVGAWALVAFGLSLQARTRTMGLGLLAALAVFAVTGLPSGNLWDALLDPWLWLVAHGSAWRQALKRPWRGLR